MTAKKLYQMLVSRLEYRSDAEADLRRAEMEVRLTEERYWLRRI